MWTRLSKIFILSSLLTVTLACDGGADSNGDDTSDESKKQKKNRGESQIEYDDQPRPKTLVDQFRQASETRQDTPKWGYSGDSGPENWGRLGPRFIMCDLGSSQSPIDIEGVRELANAPEIQIDYGEPPGAFVHTGHALQVNVPKGNAMTVGSERFELLQAHFHAPSEHTIGGEEYPLELHFVHQNDEGELGVLGVMFESGESNETLAALLEKMPEPKGKSASLKEARVDMSGLLPESRSAYRYSGSLTTPPCTEGVHWHLLTETVSASSEQIQKIQSAVGHANNRPIQPVNARIIVR